MRDLEELKSFYKDFLDAYCQDLIDFLKLDDRDSLWKERERLKKLGISFGSGATKLVVYEDSMPYVLKMPYGECRDYCKLEVEFYHKAQKNPEICDCFAWCEFLFMYDGVPIYIMEKAECDEDDVSSRAYMAAFECAKESSGISEEEESSFADGFCEEYEWMDNEDKMSALLVDSWGEDSANKFWEFCYRNDINDLHEGNWGFISGRIVAIDYSGF